VNILSKHKQVQIIDCIRYGLSIRETAETVGVAKQTVSTLRTWFLECDRFDGEEPNLDDYNEVTKALCAETRERKRLEREGGD
jgi:hypothetical protein